MSSQIIFYPVGNGDMTLIKVNDQRKTTILIDMNIRQESLNDGSDYYDVLSDLKNHLRNEDGVFHLDAFLQTHPDEDHLRGITKHFHLGCPENYSKKSGKIIIGEIWSSPLVFGRYREELCEEAQKFSTEARRRANLFKSSGVAGEGNRIRVIGEYDDNKLHGIEPITSNSGQSFNSVNGQESHMVKMNVLAPLKSIDDDDNAKLSKNKSSTIIQFEIAGLNGAPKNNLFMSGGDAEVEIWERLWAEYQNDTSKLKYHILLSPHHCSWRSLSNDSESDEENPKVSQKALNALSQAERRANIIASSKEIKQDDDTPPSYLAQKEYEKIADSVNGQFRCTATDSKQAPPEPIIMNLTPQGIQESDRVSKRSALSVGIAATSAPRRHG